MIVLKRVTDLDELMRWRAEVLRHVFGIEPSPALLAANRNYYTRHIADGSHIAYVATLDDGIEAGSGAVCFHDELPSPDNPSGMCAYLMNIYVREPFRNKGIASSIVKKLIEDAKTRGCGKIYLETTDDARSLYATNGFNELDNYMKFQL